MFIVWSGRRGSNSRHSAWKAEALPTELLPLNLFRIRVGRNINPASDPGTATAWCRRPRSSTDSRPKRESPAIGLCSGWWWGEDLNLRRLCRQIYSLFPLTTREPHRIKWSQRRDSNPRPTDYKSVALPTELRWPVCPCISGGLPPQRILRPDRIKQRLVISFT